MYNSPRFDRHKDEIVVVKTSVRTSANPVSTRMLRSINTRPIPFVVKSLDQDSKKWKLTIKKTEVHGTLAHGNAPWCGTTGYEN
ncbi:hypothetical protein LXL04_032518 [Taraxacum kok-saghyz]